nr:MAG TPA: Photosynthetic reaction centre, H-chain N-terminal region [Caudoviricetes sp.]
MLCYAYVFALLECVFYLRTEKKKTKTKTKK